MTEDNTQNSQPLPKSTNSIPTSATNLNSATNMTPPKQVESADKLAATNKLRQRVRNLQNQVAKLEQALRECHEALASREAKIAAQEKLLIQQTEALNASQEQVTRLFYELESSHQVAQRQQLLIENLSQQLESSQELLAALEQESALIQQCYNEQSHQLSQRENESRELQVRLHRQQHQTLQFKAALEKFLSAPAPSLENQAEPNTHRQNVLAAQSLLAKEQPIQPWSAPPELLAQSASLNARWGSQKPPAGVPGTGSEPLDEMPSAQIHPMSQPPQGLASIQDEAEQMTDFSETEEEPAQELAEESDEDDDMPDFSWVLQLLEDPDDDSDPDAEAKSIEDDGSEDSVNQGTDNSLPQQEVAPPEDTKEIAPQVKASSVAANYVTDVTSVADAAEELDGARRREPLLPQAHWPSPLVYPLRPPKKRKSWAAIDLPTFPPQRPS